MKLVKPHDQIYLFLGDSPADLGKPFVRLAEYYESPSKKFRRRLFSVEEFKKWYCREQSTNGKFTYYGDFNGYNVPGHVVEAFFCLYADRLTNQEMDFLRMLGKTPKRFYVIRSPADSLETIDHELSHSFWHLFPEYAYQMTQIHKGHDLSGIKKYLKENMYAPDVYADEVTSYVMFDDALLHRGGVSTKHLRPLKYAMADLFEIYRKKYIRL